MKQLKKILFYILWTIVSVFLSIGLKYIELGQKTESTFLLSSLFDWLYEYVILIVGSILGVICAIIFFIVNYYWIKPKVIQKKLVYGIQFLSLIIITLVIAKIHYILEFDLDYI